ncbi:alpha/beta hydrolase [Mucilaginibacter myungsuensis]|uniref:Alpha/beta hydrolase n=1 Tax=Mucilaginibacter myungsuensis TaxID=649104 RepID=A0A929KYG1_9SPHI|nr:alpha/beta hydrolase [Mucilaginibacter myungsuensis]MBE9662773.1 alpha/beta hydrolase [Mucilaginibacter myungsuensis]MDN3598193.1 alpha/beta hydrolase [Mucilaginibacter myungsuensis]
MKKILIPAMMLFATTLFAQEKPIPLYPKGVPNSKPAPADYVEQNDGSHANKVTVPTLTAFLPEKSKATGAAVVVCPGGGYSGLAIGHEGYAIAKKFNEMGIAAFVLKYRLPSDKIMVDKTIGPLQDAQRAVQMVRESAAEYGINPAKVGIIGFSAGGHLASTAATHFDKVVIDNPKNTSVRPDFALLIYPVITFGDQTHRGSQENLTGKGASQELIDLYSNQKQVTANTPPSFLIHSEDDLVVPVQNSLWFYEALLKNKVKAEMHLYQAGGHGFGLNNKTTPDQWMERCANFLEQNGF